MISLTNTNSSFLVIRLIGLRLCNHGNYFKISSQGKRWGWTSVCVGMTSVALGSSYYHLKPNDDCLVWDRLPMTVGAVSILAIFIIERIDEKKGTMSIIPLNMVISRSSSLWSGPICAMYCHCSHWYFGASKMHTFNILALGCMFGLHSHAHPSIPLHLKYPSCLKSLDAIAGFYLLARVGEATDRVTLKLTFHTVSSHTIKHLSTFMIPVILALMLAKRNIDVKRYFIFWIKRGILI